MDLVHQFLDFFRRNISGVLAGILKKAADNGRIRIAHLLHAVYVIQPRADDQRKCADGFFEMGNLFGGRLMIFVEDAVIVCLVQKISKLTNVLECL